jgi:type II secretory pathway component GspD/PulD (secretin)
MRPAELHPRMEGLLARPLPTSVDASGEWQGFAVDASPGAVVTINVNLRTGQVHIDGPPQQIAAWRSVVEAFDSPPASSGTITQLVATKPANREVVRKTLQVLQSGGGQSGAGRPAATLVQQTQREDASVGTAQPGAIPGQAAPADAQTTLEAAKIAEAAGLLGPVQVEFVEGLDVIVVRGNERDVQRVMEIIEQIEQISRVTVPAIEIHPLRHVDSVQLAALLARLFVSDGALGLRTGTISITPLAKPNALLLIGRTENVKMATELIQRLDQPVVPTAQFAVFQLKHASALEAKTLIDTFLGQAVGQQLRQDAVTTAMQNVPTLATRALVVADPRTNALIVSAAPRDLAEIAALVARIDTPGATAEIKVFTIINSRGAGGGPGRRRLGPGRPGPHAILRRSADQQHRRRGFARRPGRGRSHPAAARRR